METTQKAQAEAENPRPKAEPEQHMTEFGRTLYSLMLTRGLEHRQTLVKLLKENGYPISQARLTYYMNGERTIDPLFVMCVSELLGLNKDERRRVAWEHAYGQYRLSDEQRATVHGFKGVL